MPSVASALSRLVDLHSVKKVIQITRYSWREKWDELVAGDTVAAYIQRMPPFCWLASRYPEHVHG